MDMTRRELIRKAPVLVAGACAWPQLAHGWTTSGEYFTHIVYIETFGRPFSVVMTWRLRRDADGTIAVAGLEDMYWASQPAEVSMVVRRYRDSYPSMSFASGHDAQDVDAAVYRAERFLFTAAPGAESNMRIISCSLPPEWVEACRLEYDPPLDSRHWFDTSR